MAAQAALVSAADYFVGERSASNRHEFVNGTIVAMAGASRNHIELTSALNSELAVALRGRSCRVLNQDTKVYVDTANCYFYPDALIACPPNFINDHDGIIDNPKVIFEVLSESTARDDRGHKFSAYRQLASLEEYVLIDSQSLLVELYRLEQAGWTVRKYATPEDVFEIASAGISIAVAELYRHVTFEG